MKADNPILKTEKVVATHRFWTAVGVSLVAAFFGAWRWKRR